MKRPTWVWTGVFNVFVLATLLSLLLAGQSRVQSAEAPRPTMSKMEPPLIKYMASVPSSNLISVLVVLNEQHQLREEDKRRLMRTITETNQLPRMQMQRDRLIFALTDLAMRSQRPLLDYLRPLESSGRVRGISPLWLANAIGLEATSDVIHALASSNEVGVIHLDLLRPVTYAGSGDVSKALEQIKADEVPISDKNANVVIAVLDSGVGITHKNLAHNIWTNLSEFGDAGQGMRKETNHKDDDNNNLPDDVNGWDFPGIGIGDSDLTDIGKDNGHGTAVAGIIAGDGSIGARTGVAPGAQIMVLRHWTNEKHTEKGYFQGMQYAMSKHANIINLSGGLRDSDDPDYAMWRSQVQMLTDCGILFVAAAGNDGNKPTIMPPESVLVPARAPAALAVGAVDSGGTVINDSSKGPVTWTNVMNFNDYPDPPGLTKPDLVAPGKGVKSLKKGGGSANFTGTSFAAPFVSGLAAVLLAQNAKLHAYDLRFILEETAKPLDSSAFPNNSFGWGIVDASNAFYFLTNSWDSANKTTYDLAVGGLALTNQPDPTQPKPVLLSGWVTNLAGQVVGNVEMKFFYTEAAHATLSGFFPNHDGIPTDPKIEYIGSYFVPIVGPSTSHHVKFQGSVLWTPKPRTNPSNEWWIGVWVEPGAIADKEKNITNNGLVQKASAILVQP